VDIESIVQDKTYEMTDLEAGEIAGLPDGSDVEVFCTDEDDMAGFYLRTFPDGQVVVATFASLGERVVAGGAMVRNSLAGVPVATA
jgi:hypothetical protein